MLNLIYKAILFYLDVSLLPLHLHSLETNLRDVLVVAKKLASLQRVNANRKPQFYRRLCVWKWILSYCRDRWRCYNNEMECRIIYRAGVIWNYNHLFIPRLFDIWFINSRCNWEWTNMSHQSLMIWWNRWHSFS